MSNQTSSIKLPGTPKPWMNSMVMLALKTPLLRSWMGGSFLILTVTGVTTGTRYTLPVQYVRDDDRLIVLSQRTRRWWRNLRTPTGVELVLRGDRLPGVAQLLTGEAERDAIESTLRGNPRTAKFYGVTVDADGAPDPDGVAQLQDAFVAIEIELTR